MRGSSIFHTLAMLGLFTLTCLGCRSSNDILLEGFTFERLGENRYSVRFEGERLSEGQALRNLNFHTARLTIDEGATYYALDSMEAGRQTRREVEHSSSDTTGDPDSGSESIATGSETSTSYTSTVTIGRKTVVTAIATIYREAPATVRAIDAARMLEDLAASHSDR